VSRIVALSHLKSLQALDLALRCGSFKAAADLLSITPAAVGQRVKELEDYVGIELLLRSRTGLKPAAPLESAVARLRGAFDELETVAGLIDLQRGSEIRIAATSDFAELWLRPRLPEFRRAHPNISFCINGEGDAPMRVAPADCEVTFGPARPVSATDLPLFADLVLPISSPENTARIRTVGWRRRLEGFPLLHLDFYKEDPQVPDWPAWVQRHRLQRTSPNRGIRFQRISPVLEAVLAHAGLTLCGLALLSSQLEAGTLSLPFPMHMATWSSHIFQARFRIDALHRPQIRRFRDWLETQSAATRDWLSGLPGKRSEGSAQEVNRFAVLRASSRSDD